VRGPQKDGLDQWRIARVVISDDDFVIFRAGFADNGPFFARINGVSLNGIHLTGNDAVIPPQNQLDHGCGGIVGGDNSKRFDVDFGAIKEGTKAKRNEQEKRLLHHNGDGTSIAQFKVDLSTAWSLWWPF